MVDYFTDNQSNDVNALVERVAHLEILLNKIMLSDKFLFQKPLIGGPNGLRLGSMAKDKVGFYNAAPVAQFSSGAGRQDVFSNVGAAAGVGCQWDGNTGTIYYSVGDIVNALKTLGILAT